MRLMLAVATALVAVAGTARAADDTYVARHFKVPASRGLAVKKPLDEFVAVSDARVLVPKRWTAKGTTQFETPSNGACSYRVKFTVNSRIDDPGVPSARVKAAVPGSGRYVLDEGERGGGAFRVVRKPVSGGVRVDAQWSGVLTRRSDIAPSGKVVWTDLSVTASSHAGDECHSGTYREVLGPQLSDALATARATLRFARKP